MEDASCLKIDAITVGFKFNAKKIFKFVDNVRVYGTARNVAVITGYNGLNPEVNFHGLTPSFERIQGEGGTYPQTVRFTFGMQVNL